MKEIFKFAVLSRKNRRVVERANAVLNEYVAQGFILTLRQLYYQFVARGWVANQPRSYKRLGVVIGKARLAGLIDWGHIEDRTRNLKTLQHFAGAQDALTKLASWYHVSMWKDQQYRPEVWIEKDALTGVIQGVCQANDVPYFSCRGYTSLSEMWLAAERLRAYSQAGQTPYIIHFGDHDPSGIDMSRDIVDRIQKTFLSDLEFKRVALNMDQVERYKPPPNPAKVTDSRYAAYLAQYGNESWELDALEPAEFARIIEAELVAIRDDKTWKKDLEAKEETKQRLVQVRDRWEEIASLDALKGRLSKSEADLVKAEAALTKLRNGKKKKGDK